jgi:hypothetical protein
MDGDKKAARMEYMRNTVIFQVLTAASIKMAVFCVVAPCRLVSSP